MSSTKHDTTGKPWARYLRLSKQEAAEDAGKTQDERLALTHAKLDAHLTELTRWMDANGIPYSADLIFRDAGLSAWKKGTTRPDWDRMMALAESGQLAGIGIVAVDRFTRDMTTMEALINLAESTKVNIGGPRAGDLDLTTYQGIQMARGAAMQAANESLATSRRARETLARKMAAGKPMGSGRSFGFETGGEVQREAEVVVIREMANRLVLGEPLRRLAAEMNDRELRTTRDGPWTGANLGRMLGLSRYGGLVTHHGKIVGVMAGEPVLDRDTYDAVHAVLDSRRRGRRATDQFALTGVLHCSTCKRPMNGATRNKANADGSRPRIYRCPVQLGGCGRVILAKPVEDLVTVRMVRLLSDEENVEARVAEDTTLNDARAAKDDQLDAVRRRSTDLEIKRWSTGVPDEVYQPARASLDGQIAKLEAEIQELSPASAAHRYDAGGDWLAMTPQQQRQTVRDYRVRIEITAMRKGTRRFDPKRVKFVEHTAMDGRTTRV